MSNCSSTAVPSTPVPITFSVMSLSPEPHFIDLVCHERLCPSPTENPFPNMSARELLDFVAMALQEEELIFKMDEMNIPEKK